MSVSDLREKVGIFLGVFKMKVGGTKKRGWPKQMWRYTINTDLCLLELEKKALEDEIGYNNLVESAIRKSSVTRSGLLH